MIDANYIYCEKCGGEYPDWMKECDSCSANPMTLPSFLAELLPEKMYDTPDGQHYEGSQYYNAAIDETRSNAEKLWKEGKIGRVLGEKELAKIIYNFMQTQRVAFHVNPSDNCDRCFDLARLILAAKKEGGK